MSLCEFCNKGAKYFYVCPKCGNRFCQDHRKPEDHECQNLQSIKKNSEEESVSPSQILDSDNSDNISEEETASPSQILDSDNSDNISEEINTSPLPTMESKNDDNMPKDDKTEFNNLEEIPLTEKQLPSPPSSWDNIVSKAQVLGQQLSPIKTPIAFLIIVSVLSGALMGVLIAPNDGTNNLQQRYDVLYDHYLEFQTDNQDLTRHLDNMTQQLNSLQNEFETLNREYTALQNDWVPPFSDQTEYLVPTISKLKNWLAEDSTDQHIISETYSPVDQALELTLQAKKQQINLGVILIRGYFSEELTEYTSNVVETEDGVIVYIDPQSDEIWWIADNEEISPNRIWDIGEYSVNVTEVITIKKP